jgi:hypothetical protein
VFLPESHKAANSHRTETTVVVLQPGYLPWLGYFDQVRQADVFIHYDTVQYDKHGWRNRNRIKAEDGSALWLTVPVRAPQGTPINEVEIVPETGWARKHVAALRQNYRKAPYLDRYLPELQSLLGQPWSRIAELDIAVAELMSGWLGLGPRFIRASRFELAGSPSGRLVDLCLHHGATRYLSGSSAKQYLDVDLFSSRGIEVCWHDYQHPAYPQQHGRFVPYLSAIDMLMNCGEESRALLRRQSPVPVS